MRNKKFECIVNLNVKCKLHELKCKLHVPCKLNV